MHWYLADDFTVVKRSDDGSVAEHRFSSHAQARQFVEQMTGELLPPRYESGRRVAARGRFQKPITNLTSEQKKLKEEALKQFKGL